VGELRLVCPESLLPDTGEFPGAKRCTSLLDGLRGADVVMALRIQRERMDTARIPDVDAFCREWGITGESVRHAAPEAVVLHPGPMNRGVEISSDVADGPQSAVQQQVSNGVAVRMAVLATIVRNVQVRNVEAGRRAG
jgi:aspartate carbamoyltransferase catalytic subunit